MNDLRPKAGSDRQSRALILVVDDEMVLRELIAQTLAEFQVTTACHGNEAIEILQEKCFDLIITDLMMPQGDGFSILRAVRNLNRAPDVLVLTGYPSAENERLCRELGCVDVIAKPFQVAQLRDQVSHYLKNRHSGETSGSSDRMESPSPSSPDEQRP